MESKKLDELLAKYDSIDTMARNFTALSRVYRDIKDARKFMDMYNRLYGVKLSDESEYLAAFSKDVVEIFKKFNELMIQSLPSFEN